MNRELQDALLACCHDNSATMGGARALRLLALWGRARCALALGWERREYLAAVARIQREARELVGQWLQFMEADRRIGP